MTVKELKNAIADAMQTMKENKHTCTKAEKEIITAQYTKKADLENQLETMRTVIERNEKRRAAAEKATAEKTPAKKTASKPAASLKKSSSKVDKQTTADKPKEEKKTVSKTSKTSKKKTVDKPEKTEDKKWYPDNYETEFNIFSKVPEYSAEAIENKDVLIGRYFDIKAMTKKYVYSAKEHAIQHIMEDEKKAGRNPFPENIDLYEFVTMNKELYIIQSLVTTSFTSIRKDDLENAVKAGHIALYTMEEKKAPKKPTRKTSTAKKTTARKTTTK